jgi:parvulin-like peptidyl-prolyl isomerase
MTLSTAPFSKTLLAFALAAGGAFAQAQTQPKPKAAPPPTIAKPAPSAGTAAKTGPVAVTIGTASLRKAEIDTLAAVMIRSRGVHPSQVSAEQLADVRRMAATTLIGQELLALEAKARNVQATPAEVDSGMRALRAQFPDAATWQRTLRESGGSEADLRAKLARQIRHDKVLAANVKPPTAPTEAEIRDFWEKNKKEFPVNDSLRAVQILLRADGSADAADQKRRLEKVRADLLRASSIQERFRMFTEVAYRQGEGPEARLGGDLQRFHPDDFNAEFRKQVTGLKVGEVSPVFTTVLGTHLVMVTEKFDGKFESYRLQTQQFMMLQRQQALGEEMRAFLKKLAAKYPVKYVLSAYKDASEAGIY